MLSEICVNHEHDRNSARPDNPIGTNKKRSVMGGWTLNELEKERTVSHIGSGISTREIFANTFGST